MIFISADLKKIFIYFKEYLFIFEDADLTFKKKNKGSAEIDITKNV